MSMLTKLALGAMGRLRPSPAKGNATPTIALPAPETTGGIPLMEAFAKRHSAREFEARDLPLPLLSNLLWAANGINRADGHHTAPSAMHTQEIDIYVALPAAPSQGSAAGECPPWWRHGWKWSEIATISKPARSASTAYPSSSVGPNCSADAL